MPQDAIVFVPPVAAGSGISMTGAPSYGDIPVHDGYVAGTYRPRKRGKSVHDAEDYGANPYGTIQTGTMTSGSPSLTLADATNYSIGNRVVVRGAGAAHGISAPAAPFAFVVGTAAAASYRMRACLLSGDGGWTAIGSGTTITTGPTTLSASNFVRWIVRSVTNQRGWVLFGRSTTDNNQFPITYGNGQPTLLEIQCQAGSWVNAVASDVGKTVTLGGFTGVLMAYDNTNKIIWVDPTVWGTDLFNTTGGTFTIATGTGTGVQSVAAVNAWHWDDCGDAILPHSQVLDANEIATHPNHNSICRRNSQEMFVGQWMFHPFDNTGVWYQVEEVYGLRTLASSAPSYNTTVDALTVDGNVVLARREPMRPTTPPASAVNNVLNAAVIGKAGNVLTLDANAAANVTSQIVYPDNFSAIKAAITAACAAGSRVARVNISGKNYLFPGKPVDDGVGTDSRWDVTSITFDYLFSMFTVDPGHGKRIEIQCDGTLWFGNLDTPARLVDDGANAQLTDQRRVFHIKSGQFTMRGGRYIWADMGQGVLEHSDAWNWNVFIMNTNALKGIRGFDVEFLGWPRFSSMSDQRGYGDGEFYERCVWTYGGAKHDALHYTKGGHWKKPTCIGIRSRRSTLFYQDTNVLTQPMTFDGGYFLRGRTDGWRCRYSDFSMYGGFIIDDCCQIMCTDNPKRMRIKDGTIYKTRLSSPGCSFVTYQDLKMEDSTISIDATSDDVFIDNVQSIVPTSGTIWPGGTGLLNVTGGARVKVVESSFRALLTSGADIRALVLTGSLSTDSLEITNCSFRGKQDWSVSAFSYAGNLKTSGCYFYGNGGPESSLFQLSAGGTWQSVNDTWEANDPGNKVSFAGGGRIELVNPTFLCMFNITSGITGPFVIRGGSSPSANACVIADDNVYIYDHDFAVEPTISAVIFHEGCMVAGAKIATPATLASGSQELALGIRNIYRIAPNASNSTITGMSARAGGVRIVTINVGATAETLTYDHDSNVVQATEFLSSTGADIVDSPNKLREWVRDNTAGKWRNVA